MFIWKVVFLLFIWKNADSSTPKTKHSCENRILNLSCENGEVIGVIRANYGRLVRNLCNDDGQVTWSGQDCKAGITDSIIKDRCAEKQTCSIKATNRVFGDPCVGTIKYLEVEYECLPPDSSRRKTVYACENHVLNLSCEEARIIHITRANYGRLARDICNDNDQVQWSGEACKAYSSLAIANDRCSQKKTCSIEASNSVFGDRCVGTIKYLEVQYVCLPPRK